MKRLYDDLMYDHLARYQQMIFLAGARQVGKTTIARHLLAKRDGVYLNWDILEDRNTILKGHADIMLRHRDRQLGQAKPLTVLDEIHKFKDWKNYLKGFYDECQQRTHIIVTGSSRLDVFVKGGDSLMGRYFPYSVYPISVGECLNRTELSLIYAPQNIGEEQWQRLWTFGGFPEPYLQSDPRFFNQWQQTRHQQLFREDIIDLSRVSDLAQMEVLASMLVANAGQLVNYSSYARSIRVSDPTVRRWFDLLESVYYCFRVRPWFSNVSRSLRKEPKCYLHDWSLTKDKGARAENFVACHLRKAVDLWTQTGLGKFELFFLRDKDKNEVDFLVSRDKRPWFLVEVKAGDSQKLSPSLSYFQKQTKAEHAFQVVLDLPFVDEDCFSYHDPIIVPAKTLLSQLI